MRRVTILLRSAALSTRRLKNNFASFGAEEGEERSIPLECYELIASKTKAEQEQILRILVEIDKYKSK
jgi:hypothetical protein